MTLKADLENYRRRPEAPAEPPPARIAVPAGIAVNWKIVRALGLALLVWAFIATILLSV